jgi:PAS domain S-box-containing protein
MKPLSLAALRAAVARKLRLGAWAAHHAPHRLPGPEDPGPEDPGAEDPSPVDVARKDHALAESQALYRTVVESVGEVIFRIDRDGHWTFLNPAWEAITGWPVEATLGRPCLDYVHPGDRDWTATAFARLMRGEIEECHYEIRPARQDGGERWVEIRGRVLRDENGRIDGVSGTLTNITERKRVEAELHLARDTAEAANEAISNFLANMSHELRTPLNVVLGFSELIRDEVMGPIDDRYRGYAADIHVAGGHLLALVTDVLDLAQIEAGRLTLDPVPLRVDALIGLALERWAPAARGAGIALAVDLPDRLPSVLADRLRLHQMVSILLSNAVKFTRSGGRVTVTAAADADGLRLDIADTGIGMPPEDVARLMMAFQQLEPVHARRHPGAGLGLPLARRLAALHGGALEIDSALGRGTVATLRLPPERVLPEQGLPEPALAEPGQPGDDAAGRHGHAEPVCAARR